jgi:phosphoglycerate kinase
MPKFKTLDDLPADLTGEVALVRVDLNLPMKDGSATDVTRVEAVKPTILELAGRGAKVLLLAHFGRPGGQRSSQLSTSMVVGDVERVLGMEVMFIPEIVGPVVEQAVGILRAGDIGLLDNTRFWPGEEANDPELAKAIAAVGTLYVNDAFSAAHRAHATTEGLAHLLPSYAGRSMEAELKALDAALGSPETPVAAVVGGAKVSTKLAVLENLVGKVQHLIIGGGLANTFLAARGVKMILDLGPQAVEALADVLKTCRTLVWNGPLGAFETEPFDAATVALARTAAALTLEGSLVSVAGGGDTVAALAAAGVEQDFTYISTAGGAFLEWMEGRVLPGVAALEG